MGGQADVSTRTMALPALMIGNHWELRNSLFNILGSEKAAIIEQVLQTSIDDRANVLYSALTSNVITRDDVDVFINHGVVKSEDWYRVYGIKYSNIIPVNSDCWKDYFGEASSVEDVLGQNSGIILNEKACIYDADQEFRHMRK